MPIIRELYRVVSELLTMAIFRVTAPDSGILRKKGILGV